MSLALSGTGAAILALTAYNGQPALQLAALPLAGTLYTLNGTETVAGYGNSPHTTNFASFSSATPPPAISRSIDLLQDRTFTPSRTSAAGAFARANQTFGPYDKSEWTGDLAGYLQPGQHLSSISRLSPSTDAAALGVALDTGSRRPAIDVDQNRFAFFLTCSQPNNVAFLGAGTPVDFELEFETDATLAETFRLTLQLIARNN